MNLDEVKEIIISQREEIEEKFEREKIIDREISKERLQKYLKHPNVLALLGVRRCGKSVLSWQIYKNEKFAYINFDDERLLDIKKDDLNRILQAFYELYGDFDKIILDEVQNVYGWELFVNRLRRTKKVIITGSNSQLLSGELSTHLTGRYIDFTLFPFSFREYLKYNDIEIGNEDYYSTRKIAKIKKMLEDYFKLSGFPERYLIGREILVRIYGDIVEKDIVRRFHIKKKTALKELVKYLFSNLAREFSFRKMSKIVEVKDVHTLKNWVSAIENAYLGFVLTRFSPKIKEQIIAPKKFYVIDTGMVNAISFRVSEDKGRIMENIVALDLLRRKNYWNRDAELYYWKDHQQREVDFVIKKEDRVKQLIQVTYASDRDEIGEREFKSLIKASENLRCKNLLIITWDYEDEIVYENNKIYHIPLWKWLLEVSPS